MSSAVRPRLVVEDVDAAVAATMLDGGATVIVPIEDRPWGKREGRIRDPFSHLWVISQDIAPTPEGEPAE